MIRKILLSLLIGLLVGGAVYVGLGFLRRGSDGDPEEAGSGGKGKQKGGKRPSDDNDDDDGPAGRVRGSGLIPTKEWYGGSRD